MTKKVRIPVYKVTVAYRVRTKKQAKTLMAELNAAYTKLVDEWCGRIGAKSK